MRVSYLWEIRFAHPLTCMVVGKICDIMVIAIINSKSDMMLSASKLCISERNHRKKRNIFSNTELKFPHTKVDKKSLLKAYDTKGKGIMFLDLREGGIDLKDKEFNLFLLRSRPRGISVFLITKKISEIPKRIRRMTDFRLKPVSYKCIAFRFYRLDIFNNYSKEFMKSYELGKYVKKVKKVK